jgi:hypothetical protein
MRPEHPDRGGTLALQPRTIVVLGFTLLAIYAISLMFAASTYDTLVATLIGPALVLLSLPVLSRQAARENDRRLFWLLLIALLVKLILGAVGQLYVIKAAYGGVADATGYYREGWHLAPHFRNWDFNTGFHPLIGTNFIRVFTGIVLAVIGPSKTGAFMFFSWMGFWGLFFFYRAFVIAVPEGRSRTYARLVFFLPSLLFWPSAIGKDAWMVLALGIVAFGAARVLTGHLWHGLAIGAIGFWMGLMVRPHVAALAGVGLAAGYLMRPLRREFGVLAPVIKGIALLAVAVVALILVSRSSAYLREAGISNPTDVNAALGTVYQNTAIGGSNFVPSVVTSLGRAPGAAVAVLFRPILTDATNFQEWLAALEGTLLLLFTLARIRWIISALRSVVRQPFVALCLVYTVLFIVAFSSFANFGLLMRERSSVLPFFLILLSIPPKRRLPQVEPVFSTEIASSAEPDPISLGTSLAQDA